MSGLWTRFSGRLACALALASPARGAVPAPSPTLEASPLAFREVPEPRVDISIQIDRPLFKLPFGHWVLRSGTSAYRVAVLPDRPDGGTAIVKPMGSGLALERVGSLHELASAVELHREDGGLLEIGEATYRGNLILRRTARGGLHVINRVGLQDYLKGVVPAEMGPRVYDELEALKAQTIAARTYAWKHRGEFAAEGYDLCATPRCQVYGGVAVEQPLSTRAVEETADEVLAFDGALADTLFTSTCGGLTEDASNVFLKYATPVPYLVSVPCAGERPVALRTELPPTRRTTLLGTRGRALLASLGRARTAYADLIAARNALRTRLGLPLGGGPKSLLPREVYPDVVKAAAFGDGALLLEPDERDAGLGGDVSVWPPPAREAYAILLRFQLGGGTALPTERALAQEEAAGLYANLLVRLGDLEDIEGRVVSVGPATPKNAPLEPAPRAAAGEIELTLKTLKGRSTFVLAPALALFRGGPDAFEGVSSLSLLPGDRVRIVVRDGRVWGLTAAAAGAATSYERESSWIHWTRRAQGRELMARLLERDPTRKGTLVKRLEVLERGGSRRAKRVRVTTDAESFVLEGLEIRFALGLPESLFSTVTGMSSDREPVFSFYGRGWGHGVGLCQNGAFGMAVAGHSYREILGHYYPGTAVVPLATLPSSTPAGPSPLAR